MAPAIHSRLTPQSSITSLEDLKQVLGTLANHGDDAVMFRFRLLGEMWQHNFMRVISVSDNSVALSDEINGRIVVLSDLKMIIQFELDGSVRLFKPNTHYEVVAN